jgi:thymidylate synthase (FAD)
MVAYCARVSNPANQHNKETNPKLLQYLIKNQHWSPFEMVSICLEINTTRDIARQILRHRSFSFQEFSQRYAQVDDEGKPVRTPYTLKPGEIS